MTALLCNKCYLQSPNRLTTHELISLGWNWSEFVLNNGCKVRYALCKDCSKNDGTKYFAEQAELIKKGKQQEKELSN